MKPEDLKAWRERHGLSQTELAGMLGITKPCISQWESGVRKIPAFLHITLKCLKVKRGGEQKIKGKKMKKKKEVKK